MEILQLGFFPQVIYFMFGESAGLCLVRVKTHRTALVILLLSISLYHEVASQEGLEESTFSAAAVSKDITAEDAALGLLLLQVNLLISGH